MIEKNSRKTDIKATAEKQPKEGLADHVD